MAGHGARILYTVDSFGGIVATNVLDGGSDYTPNVELFPDSPTGFGAVLVPVIKNGVIESVYIKSPGSGYIGGELVIIDKQYYLRNLLPDSIVSNPVWRIFADKVEDILSENVYDVLKQLSTIKDPYTVEYIFLKLLSNQLGLNIDFSSLRVPYYDILSEDEKRYEDSLLESRVRRLVAAIYEYYENCGTSKLEDILSYAVSIGIKIVPLWTNDYSVFYTERLGGDIYSGTGSWFLTPHVEVQIDGANYYKILDINNISALLGSNYALLGNIGLGISHVSYINYLNAFDEEAVRRLFYELAPINLVLERFSKFYLAWSTIYTVGAAHTKIVSDLSETEPHLFVVGGSRSTVHTL